jgi:hypothetical protein
MKSKIEGKIPNEFEWPLTLSDVQDSVAKIWSSYAESEFFPSQGQRSVRLSQTGEEKLNNFRADFSLTAKKPQVSKKEKKKKSS